MSHKKANQVNQKTLTIIISVIIALTIVIFVVMMVLQTKKEAVVEVTKTVQLEGLHPSYSSIKQMLSDPDLAFAGRAIVLDNGTVRSKVVENAPPEAPPLVNTDYNLQVKSVLKGKDTPGEITLSLSGGPVEGTRYVYKNVPVLKKGDVIVVFASKGDDGKYYPLAGSTAIAVKKPGQDYKLGDSTINTGAVTFTEQDISK